MSGEPQPPLEALLRLTQGELIAVGVDVLSINRLERALTRSPKLFTRLCAEGERAGWVSASGGGLAWASALWVSKEASVKCLKTGFWRQGVDWPQLNTGEARALKLSQGLELSTPHELSARSEEALWSAWRPWQRVSLGGAARALTLDQSPRARSSQRDGESLWCCALRAEGYAWGFAAMIRSPHS